jgi:hypothetical protein
MSQAFAQPDRQLAARKALLEIKQIGSVQDYVRHIRMLITRAGHPASSDHDLLLLFYKGLNHNIQHECKINPMTGKFWDQFESRSHCSCSDC